MNKLLRAPVPSAQVGLVTRGGLRSAASPPYVPTMNERPSAVRRAIDARLGLRAPDEPSETGWIVRLPGPIMVLLAIMAFLLLASGFEFWRAGRLDTALGFVPARFAAWVGGEGAPTWGRARPSVIGAVAPALTHQFLHAGLGHLGVNAIGLVLFGTGVARRLRADGSLRSGGGAANRFVFAAFFLTCGAAGALAYALLDPGSARPLIGASGAVSGLMGGAMRFAMRRFAPYGVAEGPLAPILSLPIIVVSGAFLATNLATAIGAPMPFLPSGDIGWHAHIGGYLFGLLAFPWFDRLAARPASRTYG